MKTARILISIMAFLSLSARASDTSAIGVGIGNTVFYEVGPVYRQYFNNQLGIIAAVTGKYNQYSKKIGGSLAGLYIFKKINFNAKSLPDLSFKFYGLMLAESHYYQNRYDEKHSSFVVGGGPGMGFEFNLTKNLAVSVDLPWITSFKIKKTAELNDSMMAASASFNFYF